MFKGGLIMMRDETNLLRFSDKAISYDGFMYIFPLNSS